MILQLICLYHVLHCTVIGSIPEISGKYMAITTLDSRSSSYIHFFLPIQTSLFFIQFCVVWKSITCDTCRSYVFKKEHFVVLHTNLKHPVLHCKNNKNTISITGINSATIRAFFYSIIATVNWNLTLSICLSFLLKLFWLKWQSPNYLLTARHYLEDLWEGLLKKSGTWKKGKKINGTL